MTCRSLPETQDSARMAFNLSPRMLHSQEQLKDVLHLSTPMGELYDFLA